MSYVIGVDLDNTLVSYDQVLGALAVERGLMPAGMATSKKLIRDWMRRRPDGELEWQRLQALVYGRRMGEAVLIDGVREFFDACRRHGAKVYIVSHKSEYSPLDESRTNLRHAALTWMACHAFFDAAGFGLGEDDVYFEATRRSKVERIRALRCSHFIDDLEETFLEPAFPTAVERILYARGARPGLPSSIKVATTWQEIREYVFGAAR